MGGDRAKSKTSERHPCRSHLVNIFSKIFRQEFSWRFRYDYDHFVPLSQRYKVSRSQIAEIEVERGEKWTPDAQTVGRRGCGPGGAGTLESRWEVVIRIS